VAGVHLFAIGYLPHAVSPAAAEHERAVAAFLASCDPARAAALEAPWPVLSERQIERREQCEIPRDPLRRRVRPANRGLTDPRRLRPAGLGAYKRVTRDRKDREEHNEGRSACTAGVSWRSTPPGHPLWVRGDMEWRLRFTGFKALTAR
jgi:hypothetical protein